MICPHCGSTSYRVSRFRIPDLVRLLCLQYPVRCRMCHERKYVGIQIAREIRKTEKRHRQERNERPRQVV
jgi:hypothetical protein